MWNKLNLFSTWITRNPFGYAFSSLTLGNHYGVRLAFGAVAHFSFTCGISSANGCQNTLGKELSTLYGKYAKNVGRLLEYVATISVIKAFSNEENRTERVLGGMRDYIRWVKAEHV